jgi:hypothetical protein
MAETATKNTSSNHTDHWKATASKAGLYEFNTAGTFVDRNIDFEVPAGEMKVTTSAMDVTKATAAATISGMQTSDTETDYKITLSKTAGNVNAAMGINNSKAGWVDSITLEGNQSLPVDVVIEKDTFYIPEAEYNFSVTGSYSNGNISVTNSKGIPTTTDTSTGIPLSITATHPALTASVSGSTKTEGYLSKDLAFSTKKEFNAPSANNKTIYLSPITSLSAENGDPLLYLSGTKTTIRPEPETESPLYISSGTALKPFSVTVQPMSAGTAAVQTGGTTTVDNTTKAVTRGTYKTTSSGYAPTKELLSAATFANTATEGTTYVDISDTTEAPVLVSGSGLYINKGYTDNLYINLAKLTPDKASGASNIKSGMLNSVSAYDNDGNLVTGNIVTRSASEVSHSGKTVSVPSGYYSSSVSHSVDSGSYTLNGGTGSVANSISELSDTISGATRLTGKFSTTAPSSGYYVALQAPQKTVSIKPTATITSGYIANGTAATTTTNATATTTASSKYYVNINAGSITNNTSGNTSTGTISAGSQIKIGAGYYPNDVTYTAQAASATSQAKYSLGTTATGIKTSSTATSYYVTPTKTVTTAGYLATSTAPTATTPTYIQAGSQTISKATSALVDGSSTTLYNSTIGTVSTGTPYLYIKSTANYSEGYSTAKTNSTETKIPIYTGSFSVS